MGYVYRGMYSEQKKSQRSFVNGIKKLHKNQYAESNIFETKHLLIPACYNNHWILACVCNLDCVKSNESKNLEILFMDSKVGFLDDKIINKILKCIIKYLETVYEIIYKKETNHFFLGRLVATTLRVVSVKLVRCPSDEFLP